MTTFALAPMSRGIAALTALLLALPVALVAAGLVLPHLLGLAAVGVFVAASYAGVWVWWRPTAFEVGAEGLRIRFPGRTRSIPTHDLAGARTLTGRAFRDEAGLALRIGAGGLWGGFGWLWTRRRGLLEFYVSRTDGFVWIERRTGRPLLLTPDDPERMLRALPSSGPASPSKIPPSL
jgi:hypothetical protein